MSPLLASLALLALCWQPSAGLSWKMESQNLGSFISKEQQSQVGSSINAQASIAGGNAILARLFNLIPNTLMILGLETAKASDKVLFMMPSFGNGALCELDDPTLPEKLRQVHLDAGKSVAEVNEGLAIILKQSLNIDCATQPPTVDLTTEGGGKLSAGALQKTHKCFCTERKGLYCVFAAIKFAMEAAMEKKSESGKIYPCLNETVPALRKAGSGVLGSHYDLQNIGQNAINDAMSGNVDAFSNDQMKNLLCDAVDPEVEAAVKAVYASDGLYWFTESLLYAVILGNNQPAEKTVEMTLPEYCALEAVKADEYGKCFCKANKEGEGTGFTFCIYKVVAEYFINEGYLTCDKADKTKHTFVAGRKPRAIPSMAQAKAPTGGAATSSLTIATLAAAALLLINH